MTSKSQPYNRLLKVIFFLTVLHHPQCRMINSPISSIQSSHCGYTPVLSK